MPFEQYLSIAGVKFCVKTDAELPACAQFSEFFVSPCEADYSINFTPTDNIARTDLNFLQQSAEMAVCRSDAEFEQVVFFDRRREGEIYALRESDYAEGSISVRYLRDRGLYVSEWNNSFLHVGFESLMARRGRFILHSSLIRSPYGGILFSGVSGIGKSTQADLWCKNTDSELLNGDRSILTAAEGQWTAWGSPYAGSSNCYRNESADIRAIVMLRQSRENSIRLLNPAESFKALFRGLTVSLVDKVSADNAIRGMLELTAAVPVYELSCTPDIRAVETLMRELERS